MKKDNKGFSLVELIIVIAIMAILVGIVGSQVLPYLNKSREAKDQQIVSGFVTAALSAYSANATEVTGTATIKLEVTSSNGNVRIPTSNAYTGGFTNFQKSFEDLAGVTTSTGPNFASNTYKNGGDITITVDPTGNPVVYISAWTAAQNGSVSTTELVAK